MIGTRRVVGVLERQGITVAVLGGRAGTEPSGPTAAALVAADADRAVRGEPVSATVDVAGTAYLVQARPARTGAFALVRPADTGPLPPGLVRRNIGQERQDLGGRDGVAGGDPVAEQDGNGRTHGGTSTSVSVRLKPTAAATPLAARLRPGAGCP